jgi:hypothetical protein
MVGSWSLLLEDWAVCLCVMSPLLHPKRHRSSVECATEVDRRDMFVNFGLDPISFASEVDDSLSDAFNDVSPPLLVPLRRDCLHEVLTGRSGNSTSSTISIVPSPSSSL